MRVLIVEDDTGIADGLSLGLRHHGCATDVANSLGAARAVLAAESFDIVLLDLGLPDGDGQTLLRQMRSAHPGTERNAQIPVLIMTARDEVASRIAGLDLGADDYMPKPFHIDELAARMRALRRRAVGRASAELHVLDIEIRPATREVLHHGQPVTLSAREFDILRVLAEASPRVLARTQIEAALYAFADSPESNAVEVHIHHLRRKLGDGVIRTMRGVGYFVPGPPQ